NKKTILLIVISMAIASTLFAQTYSLKDIYLKSSASIQSFNKGSFTVSVEYISDSSVNNGLFGFDPTVKSGQLCMRSFHKGSSNEFFFISNIDYSTRSGRLIFYKDSSEDGEVAQFFLVQNSDTVL